MANLLDVVSEKERGVLRLLVCVARADLDKLHQAKQSRVGPYTLAEVESCLADDSNPSTQSLAVALIRATLNLATIRGAADAIGNAVLAEVAKATAIGDA